MDLAEIWHRYSLEDKGTPLRVFNDAKGRSQTIDFLYNFHVDNIPSLINI